VRVDVAYQTAAPGIEKQTPEIAREARAYTIRISCVAQARD
jgi:hypothetical protein